MSKLAAMRVPVASSSSSTHTLPSTEHAYRCSRSAEASAQLYMHPCAVGSPPHQSLFIAFNQCQGVPIPRTTVSIGPADSVREMLTCGSCASHAGLFV